VHHLPTLRLTRCAAVLRAVAPRLERVRETTGFDGLERITSQSLMDLLEVAQRDRTAGPYRHLAKVMTELDWAAVRVRDFNRRGFKEQCRGFVRDARAAR
jgi:hypothetical protein